MNGPIILQQGNTPLVTAVLTDEDGNVVDLTGATVAFAWQQVMGILLAPFGGSGNNAPYSFVHPATVASDPTTGGVSYQFAEGETAIVGDFEAQWQVTPAGGEPVVTYPIPSTTVGSQAGEASVICFRIVQPLPKVSPQNIVLIAQMREPIRATLGDFDRQFEKYSDGAIDSVVRTCLLVGKVPGQTVGADRQSVTPGITMPCDMARLMYHGAMMFLAPDAAKSSYRTRALSESFGEQTLFYRNLENAIYDLQNGAMMSSFQSFYSWVNSLTGLDIWSVMSDMNTQAPVATVSIGRAGVTVTTT